MALLGFSGWILDENCALLCSKFKRAIVLRNRKRNEIKQTELDQQFTFLDGMTWGKSSLFDENDEDTFLLLLRSSLSKQPQQNKTMLVHGTVEAQ